jgi:hypothetical protein
MDYDNYTKEYYSFIDNKLFADFTGLTKAQINKLGKTKD